MPAWGGGGGRTALLLGFGNFSFCERERQTYLVGTGTLPCFLSLNIKFLPLILPLLRITGTRAENLKLWRTCLRQKLMQLPLEVMQLGGLRLLMTAPASLSSQQKPFKGFLQFCSLGTMNDVQTFPQCQGSANRIDLYLWGWGKGEAERMPVCEQGTEKNMENT